MSNLLSQASLVMIPSGYKEDIVYSPVPTNGNGDLSFTRASNGTRINSAGLVEVCPWNLLQYSEDFSNSVWTTSKYNATVTANDTTAPNGTLTADKVVFTTDGYLYYATSNFSPLEIPKITFSIYSKTSTQSVILGGASISGTDVYSFEDVGNGWYRQSLTRTFNTTSTGYLQILPYGSNVTKYFWGAQLNIGSTAKPYFPTTDRLNVPRLTYQNGGGGCPSLLLEKQSTNLVTYSEDFTNSDWNNAGGASVVANNAISPDGTQNADTSLTSAVNGLRNYVGGITNGASYTLTLYVKQASSSSATHVRLTVNNTSNWTGAASNKVALTNEWQRITLNWTATGTAAYFLIGSADETGSGDASCYGNVAIWGAQLEQSSYPTTYIQTTSSSATRVAEICAKTGISSLIGQTEGVLFIDFDFNGNYSSGGIIPISTVGTPGSEMYIWVQTSGLLLCEVANSGIQASISGAIGALGRKKIALAYKQNDFVVYLNGTQVGTDTSGTVPAQSAVYVGKFYANNTYNLNAGINQAVLFPTRLTNAELASLTTI